ncbi:MAG: efflux RND transporter periplasmic adaptor subunit [bacterium]
MIRNALYLTLTLFAISAFTGCTGRSGSAIGDQPVRVRIAVITPVAESSKYYIGTIEASLSVPLSFMTTGMVEQVLVAEGSKVKKGQKLAILSDDNYRQTYQMAMAKENQAEDAYRRLSELYQKGSLPEIRYVEVQTGLEQAKAATQVARKNLADCELFAPADGIIGKRSLEAGENAVPLKTVMTLVDIRRVNVKISVPEKEIGHTTIGQEATIQLPALDDEIFRGKVSERGVVANPVSHTYDVRIMVENPAEKLMPGMIGRVYLGKSDPTAMIVIPLNTVLEDEKSGKYVYLADQASGKAIKRPVTTGPVRDFGVVITRGLSAGDHLIIEGYQQLNENVNIKIVGSNEN